MKGTSAEVVKTMSDKIASLPVPGPGVVGSNKTTQDLTGVLDEFMEKEKRKANLVVHNLPEQPGESSDERAKNDAFLFKTMNKEEMNLNVSVTTSFCVRKRVSGKARLLIVTLPILNILNILQQNMTY